MKDSFVLEYLFNLKDELHKKAIASTDSYCWAQFFLMERILKELEQKNVKEKNLNNSP